MGTLRAVVCGTTFGRLYAAGIRLRPSEYRLVGILSRGSEQSREIAEKQGVPLCTEINELPEHDIAFVVVRPGVLGGDGERLAQDLLSSGSHVVMEHPIDRSGALDCYREAAKNDRLFLVNSFYRNSSTIMTYIKMAKTLHSRYGIAHIESECSIHFLFSMLDIVGRITGGFTPWRVELQGGESEVFVRLSASFKGVPVDLRVVNRMDPFNPDDFVHAGHRLTVFTAAGSLVLTETDGGIVWHPNITSSRDAQGVLTTDDDTWSTTAMLHEELTIEKDVTRRALFEDIWPASVAAFLDVVSEQISHPERHTHEAEYTLTLCSVWARVGGLLGPSRELRSHMSSDYLSLERLKECAGVDLAP